MRILGLEISLARKQLTPVAGRTGWGGGWWGRVIGEPFAGAWQRNCEERLVDTVCYPTLYACLNRVVSDIGKLPFQLMQRRADGVWEAVSNTAYSPVLRKPNHYQTAQQFREAWVMSLLKAGNTYILKRRDERGVVNALYVLDPDRVIPMVSDSGDVFYQLQTSTVQGLLTYNGGAQVVVPASEIIHHRINCFHNQLIGVPPLCAANWPAVKNMKILRTATEFFANGARPSGILTVPAGMSEDDAAELTEFWSKNYTGVNSGKVALLGADVKYQELGLTNSTDAQLVEQMRYSDEQVCQPFGIHPFIVGIGTIPAGMKVDDMAGMYYQFALQAIIEGMEYLLDEGLSITPPLSVELDLEPLLRMDPAKRAETWVKLVGGGIASPNDGRKPFNLPPLEGGDTVYMQQQDIPLSEARKNTIQQPALPEPTEPEPEEQPDPEEQERALIAAINKHLEAA